jgi:hypothetical protein
VGWLADFMSTEDFYARLVAERNLEACLRRGACAPLPDDWDLAVADVADSTRAIEAGRYKEVNVVAASAIVAVLNALRGVEAPFVFGGDGATLATPASRRAEVAHALAAARGLAREEFGFELRAGIVPVAQVRAAGAEVRVGRLAGGGTFPMAALAGAGLREAERILKAGGAEPVDAAAGARAASFEGLQCRWQPIRNRNGAIATLLVLPRAEKEDALLCRVLERLREAGAAPDVSPVDAAGLALTTSAAALEPEARVRTRGWPAFARRARLALMQGATAVGWKLMRGNARALGVDWGDYRRAAAANTDHLKLAGSLQCLLDVEPERFARMRAWLEERQRAGELAYGCHLEPTAHMTCMVPDMATRHFHFIDGAQGGYTRASQGLKANLRALGVQ